MCYDHTHRLHLSVFGVVLLPINSNSSNHYHRCSELSCCTLVAFPAATFLLFQGLETHYKTEKQLGILKPTWPCGRRLPSKNIEAKFYTGHPVVDTVALEVSALQCRQPAVRQGHPRLISPSPTLFCLPLSFPFCLLSPPLPLLPLEQERRVQR